MENYFKEYKIISKLNIIDPFSIYYLVSKDSKNYILRIFSQNLDINDEIIEKVKEITKDLQQHLCVIYDFGYYDKNYYQILEYPVYGSLSNYIKEKLLTNNGVNKDYLNQVIEELLKALNELHSNGIGILFFNSDNIFVRSLSKLDLVFVSFNIPPLIDNEELFFENLLNNYKDSLAPENLNNIFSFESDYYSLGRLVYRIFKNKEFSSYDYEAIKYDVDIPIDYKVLLLGLLSSNNKNRFSFNEVSLFLNNKIDLLIDKLVNITNINYDYIKNVPFANKVFSNLKDLFLEFVKTRENFDLALKLFFNYLLNKLNLNDYRIFNEIKRELEDKSIVFSIFISVKLEQFYLFNFLITLDLIKMVFKDSKHILAPFFINYIDYLFSSSFEYYKNSIFYFYSIFSKLSNKNINYLENFFYNLQNLVLDLDFEFYSNYYHLKNNKGIFIRFLNDLFNEKFIFYKGFDIFYSKIEIEIFKDQRKFILLPKDYFQKLSSDYVLPKEFKNLANMDFKDYIDLINWLLKNRSKLIRGSEFIKNKQKIPELDILSYEKLFNSKNTKRNINFSKVFIILISLFLFLSIFWFFVNNIKNLEKLFSSNVKNTTTTLISTTNNLYSNINYSNYNNYFIYDQLKSIKIKKFGGSSYEEFYNIYNFQNYYYILGISNSFGFGSFDTFIVKLDSNLNYIFSYSYGNSLDNVSYKLLPYLDSFIFIGYTSNQDSSYNAHIVKINNEGKIIYQYVLNDLYNSQFLDIATYKDDLNKNTLNENLLVLGEFYNQKINAFNSFLFSCLDNGNSIKNEVCKLIYTPFENQFLNIYFLNKNFILFGNIIQNNENISYLKLTQNLKLLKSFKIYYNYHINLINSFIKDNYIIGIGDVYIENKLWPFIVLIDSNDDKILKAFFYKIDNSIYLKSDIAFKFISIYYFDNYYYILSSLSFYNNKKYFIIKLDNDFNIIQIKEINLNKDDNLGFDQIQLNYIFKNILVGKIGYKGNNFDGLLIKFSDLSDIVENNLYNHVNNGNAFYFKDLIVKENLNIIWDKLLLDLVDFKAKLTKSDFNSLNSLCEIYDIK